MHDAPGEIGDGTRRCARVAPIHRLTPAKPIASWLDHSGNIIRFMEDFSEIYYNGLDGLGAGNKLDKTIRRDADNKEPKNCPVCGYSVC